ncbi:MAG: L,D-transpeptidase family protein [Desulfarculus sp.]|nr:L,D-transpeptidase family protein [Desulfarculus sp.]
MPRRPSRPPRRRPAFGWVLALLLLAAPLSGPAGAADLVVSPEGWAEQAGQRHACVLGRSGVFRDKREGDGATPAGDWPVRRVWFRPDRQPAPLTAGLPVRAIAPDDGWCDDPGHPEYNRPVKLPFPASHEKMWREDRLYDLVVELGYNDDPVVPGRGSAIFLHLARPDRSPTAGCVAFAREDLLAILSRLGPGDKVRVLER